ncbi:MAG: hypothetical protein U1E46_12040 [Hyphomicrobiales bacterium]
MSIAKSAVIAAFFAIAATGTSFASDALPRAGSGGGPGRPDFWAQETQAAPAAKPVIGASKPATASMVRSGTGGSNSLGGRAIARPFTPTPAIQSAQQ